MTVVTQILDRMSGITKLQRKCLLALFVTMLVIRTRLNFLNLSCHSALHDKTYRHHFRKAFAFVSFNRIAIARAVPAPNARHHPRPRASCMRDFVMGRRVHAVVMPPMARERFSDNPISSGRRMAPAFQ